MSRALHALKHRAHLEEWSTVDLAKRLGCSQPTASRLLRGERGPSLGLGNKIQEELGIPVGWWGEPEPPATPAPESPAKPSTGTEG